MSSTSTRPAANINIENYRWDIWQEQILPLRFTTQTSLCLAGAPFDLIQSKYHLQTSRPHFHGSKIPIIKVCYQQSWGCSPYILHIIDIVKPLNLTISFYVYGDCNLNIHDVIVLYQQKGLDTLLLKTPFHPGKSTVDKTRSSLCKPCVFTPSNSL